MPAAHKADKKISAHAANKPFLSTLLPLTLSSSLEAQVTAWSDCPGVWDLLPAYPIPLQMSGMLGKLG